MAAQPPKAKPLTQPEKQMMQAFKRLNPLALLVGLQRRVSEKWHDWRWERAFARTTDEQWEAMIAQVEAEIEAGEVYPIESLYEPPAPSR